MSRKAEAFHKNPLIRGILFLVFLVSFYFVGLALFVNKKPQIKNKRIAEFNLTDSLKKVQKLSALQELKNKKSTWLVYWATWCLPCLEELRIIQAVKKSGSPYNVVLINSEGSSDLSTYDRVRSWLQENDLVLDTYFDLGARHLELLGVSALPFSVLLDSSLSIKKIHYGGLKGKDLR